VCRRRAGAARYLRRASMAPVPTSSRGGCAYLLCRLEVVQRCSCEDHQDEGDPAHPGWPVSVIVGRQFLVVDLLPLSVKVDILLYPSFRGGARNLIRGTKGSKCVHIYNSKIQEFCGRRNLVAKPCLKNFHYRKGTLCRCKPNQPARKHI
jgi:hypothetical protein